MSISSSSSLVDEARHIKLLKAIGEGLKELRLENGHTSYEQFALTHDLDRKQYWRTENGSNMTLKTLIIILQIHDVSMVEFFQNHAAGDEEES